MVVNRRQCMAGGVAMIAAGAVGSSAYSAPWPKIIYSPAPVGTLLDMLNRHLLEAMRREGMDAWAMEPVALPKSINQAAGMDRQARRWAVPIVTTADFALARAGGGPDWHGYTRPNIDLLFVSVLYDVGFGLQVLDRTISRPRDLSGRAIGVPPRPSAVRMMTEALLFAGWGIDDVRFVDCSPAQGRDLLARREIDALAWNLIIPGPSGSFAPMLDMPEGSHFLPIDPAVVDRMNAHSGMELGAFSQPGFPSLVSFAQALAAWRDTPVPVVARMARAIAEHGRELAGLPDARSAMFAWPRLTDSALHPGVRGML